MTLEVSHNTIKVHSFYTQFNVMFTLIQIKPKTFHIKCSFGHSLKANSINLPWISFEKWLTQTKEGQKVKETNTTYSDTFYEGMGWLLIGSGLLRNLYCLNFKELTQDEFDSMPDDTRGLRTFLVELQTALKLKDNYSMQSLFNEAIGAIGAKGL